ncbi:hypothetical protein J5N97_003066 [Dioscorea zingiberensis]|uniref:Pentatricopeptide repeat-containing protein n=1 Tax=Dioscorea zingiberensis TaxID=325984 RepID=A0A9D5D3E7_9LILI|nr:hypothetical protein J5N97_003066 [Dioscorea zingiberensis]
MAEDIEDQDFKFVNTHLPSDLVVGIWEASFQLHKFPPLSKCGKVAHALEESENTRMEVHLTLDGCPGRLDTFINAAKICYGFKVEVSPTSILVVYCITEILGRTDEFGEEKLLAQSEAYFHKVVLRSWKDCIVALQGADNSILRAESLQIVHKCLSALSIMVCTNPSLFGWPMMMYRSLQSPGGDIIWNGINTGSRIRSSISDWWFEDAILAFLRMEQSEVELNEATLVTTLSSCVSLGDLEIGKKVHGFMKNREFKGNILLNNALLDIYTQYGYMSVARRLFDENETPSKDVISWTSIAPGMQILIYWMKLGNYSTGAREETWFSGL